MSVHFLSGISDFFSPGKKVKICRERERASARARWYIMFFPPYISFFWFKSNYNTAWGWRRLYTQELGLSNGSINGFLVSDDTTRQVWGGGGGGGVGGQGGEGRTKNNNFVLVRAKMSWWTSSLELNLVLESGAEGKFWPMTTMNNAEDDVTNTCMFSQVPHLKFSAACFFYLRLRLNEIW